MTTTIQGTRWRVLETLYDGSCMQSHHGVEGQTAYDAFADVYGVELRQGDYLFVGGGQQLEMVNRMRVIPGGGLMVSTCTRIIIVQRPTRCWMTGEAHPDHESHHRACGERGCSILF